MIQRHITLQDTRNVAKLARLALSDDKLTTFTAQLQAILGAVDQIQAVDVTGVEPMAHPLTRANVLRDDQPTEGLSIEQVLANAPQRDGRFFAVPKVIGGDEDSAG